MRKQICHFAVVLFWAMTADARGEELMGKIHVLKWP
jgi:hypothetical protein